MGRSPLPGPVRLMTEKLTVKVILLNDDGDREEVYASGETVEDAVQFAEEAIAAQTGDDSFVMTDWEAG